MGNAIFLRSQKGGANNVDVESSTLDRKWRWHDRKSGWFWIRPGQTPGATTWWATVTSAKETSHCLNLPLGFFLAAFWFSWRGNKQLFHFIMNVPGVVVQCKRLGIRIFFFVNANESEYFKSWWIRKHLRIRKNLLQCQPSLSVKSNRFGFGFTTAE